MEKVPTRNLGDLGVPPLPLKTVQSSGSFYVKARENGRGKRWLTPADTREPAEARGRPWNFFVVTRLTPVDVNSVTVFPPTFAKRSLSLYTLPWPPREGRLLVRGCFCKTRASGRIPLRISLSVCDTKQRLLGWRRQGQSRLEQDGVRDLSHDHRGKAGEGTKGTPQREAQVHRVSLHVPVDFSTRVKWGVDDNTR